MTIENDKPKVKDMPKPAKAVGRQTIKSSIGRGVSRTGGRLFQNLSRRSAQVIANALRQESRVAVLSIIRGAARILMANVITALITLAAFTLYDSIFFFRKERSAKQLLVDFISNVWVISWGTTAFMLWEFTTQHIFETVGEEFSVINFIAGFLISILVCLLAGSIFDRVASRFYKSDTMQMLEIIGEEFEHETLEKEMDQDQSGELLAKLQKIIKPKTIRQMYKSDDRNRFALELIKRAEEIKIEH